VNWTRARHTVWMKACQHCPSISPMKIASCTYAMKEVETIYYKISRFLLNHMHLSYICRHWNLQIYIVNNYIRIYLIRRKRLLLKMNQINEIITSHIKCEQLIAILIHWLLFCRHWSLCNRRTAYILLHLFNNNMTIRIAIIQTHFLVSKIPAANIYCLIRKSC